MDAIGENQAALLDVVLSQYTRGKRIAIIARIAGVTVRDATALVTTPQFQAALRRHTQIELAQDAAMARRHLRRILLDRKSTDKVKNEAAKTLLALGGFVAPKAQDPNRAPESPAEMTSDQLRDYLSKIEGELAARSTPVDAQPSPPSITQAIDLL